MIQGLIYFSIFTQDLSNNIDSCVGMYREKGICNNPSECASISALQDYADFIRNNNKTLGTTISLLTGFYLKDESDQSADVEMNLRAFGTYVNNLNEKDSVLNQALRSMDKFVLSDKTLKTKKSELTSLKSIRDQLLLQGVQLAGLLQDKPLCSQLLSYALSSQSALNVLYNQDNLGIKSSGTLNMIKNSELMVNVFGNRDVEFGSNAQLGKLIEAQQLGVVNSQQNLGNLVGSIILYDKSNLQFVVGNKPELQKILSSSQVSAILQGSATLGNLAGVAVFSSQGLNLYQANINLNANFNGVGTLSNSQLNQVLSNQDLGVIIYSSGFIGLVGQLGSHQLGN
jgi:hypothetical protein